MQPQFEFEWDDEKADENLRKHGVEFEEAQAVFLDPFARTKYDPDHSREEHRFIILGYSKRNRLLVVCYALRESRFRLINARRANRKERQEYEEKKNG